ncbi:hypothetical protein PR202_ga14531 [Eleusine coracana subsp. coracana]|uniref:Uncharacterized protein n=1 Tax=Eleusine coracana subsp. coracana TaxID=191504 RepID=A0AAV5CHK7_ELECO|nr:hypothetical protein PR202_ga14531 [Eleusine coracana subsp. coracana]
MGVLDQTPAQSVQQQPRLQGQTADDGSTTLMPEMKDSTCQKGNSAQGAEMTGFELVLPQDILCHIHALMPMKDAARAAGVSCGFRRSWESYPKLIFDIETLAAEVGCLNNLTTVDLRSVHITGEELYGFLSNTLALERLELTNCSDIVCLKIPCLLSNLNVLEVYDCVMLEMVNTPMVSGKFIHLKYLEIVLIKPSCTLDYDFCSLVSFLDGSPALETFVLRIEVPAIRHDSILECSDSTSLHPRRISGHCHENLKNVMITGFCSAKSMIELTNHILERTPSLNCITLDTSRGHDDKAGNCSQMFEEDLMEAQRARLAIGRYLEQNVPSTVSLKLIEPCTMCKF